MPQATSCASGKAANQSLPAHQAVFEKIRDQDAAGAFAAMRDWLEANRKRFQK